MGDKRYLYLLPAFSFLPDAPGISDAIAELA
jgi:hypothetical protein